MALSHTDRGDTSRYAADSATTLASGSFAPANGTLLTASGYMIVGDGGGASGPFTMSSTTFTTSGWSSNAARAMNDGGTYSLYTAVWTATVTSSASGTVVLTRPAGSFEYWMVLQIDEWAGHNGVGLANSADDGRATGSTLTVGFGGTPATTSGAVGIVGDNNGATTGAVQPTGWTESSDIGHASVGNSLDAAWRLTSVQASPQWTSLQSGTFGKIGSVLEVLESGAAFMPPLPIVISQAVTTASYW